MRVAHVIPRWGEDPGAEHAVREIAPRMSAAGFDVEVLVQRPGLQDVEINVRDGVVVRRFPVHLAARAGEVSPALVAHLARGASAADIVHAHGDDGLIAAAAADLGHLVASPAVPVATGGVRRRLRLIGGGHAVPARRGPDSTLARARRVVCGSRTEAALLVARFGVPADRVAIVPKPIDVAAISRSQPLWTDARVVLVVAPLERWRGIQRAIAGLVALDRRFELVVIGSGPARRWLRNFAADLAVGDRVRFVPSACNHDRYRWLRTASVLVAPVDHTLDATVLEAACAGTSVVAADVPAHREAAGYLPDGAVQLVARHTSPICLADAILLAAGGAPPPDSVRVPTWTDAMQAMARVYASVVTGGDLARAGHASGLAAHGGRPG